MARPAEKTSDDRTKLSPKTEAKIKEGLQHGLTRDQACDYANISRSLFYEVLAKNSEKYEEGNRLSDRIVAWENDLSIRAKFNIAERILAKSEETSRWHLERREKENYSLRQEVTGKDGEKLFELSKEKKKELDNLLNDNVEKA